MSKKTYYHEELSEFLEEHISELVKLKVLSHAKYKEYDESIINYFTADNVDDLFRLQMYQSQMDRCVKDMTQKMDKKLKEEPELKKNKLVKDFLRLSQKAKSETEEELSLLDDGDAAADFNDMIIKIAEGLKGETLTADERERVIESFASSENMSKAMAGYANQYYHYECPDYSKLAQWKTLDKPLYNYTPWCEEDEADYRDFGNTLKALAIWGHEKQVNQLTRLVYAHLEAWQKEKDAWMYSLRATLAMIEHFKLSECVPVILEMLRQSYEFHEKFFIFDTLEEMPAAVLCNIVTADQLPMLFDFMKEPGLLFSSKRQVALAVAHLPKHDETLLPQVQQWLADVLNFYYPLGSGTDMFDECVLDTLAYCCIHTRAVELKPLLINCYSKYKIPPVMVTDGSQEVRMKMKKAELGTLEEDNAEEMLIASCSEYHEEEDDGGEEDDEEWNDEDFNLDDYDCQEYEGWAEKAQAIYKPAVDVKRYTLHIKLSGIKPPIWREVEVPSNLTLSSLASVILLAMGWNEDHLHQFIVGQGRKAIYYATSIHEIEADSANFESRDGRKYSIGDLLKCKGGSVTFEYDYGDSWLHTVTLTASEEYGNGKKEVNLLAGERACPPEDCGGFPGYQHLCQLMKKPNSSEAQEQIEWLGFRYDPERFPLKEAQKAVKNCNC